MVAGALLSGAVFTFALCEQIEGRGTRFVPDSAGAETFNQSTLDALVGNLRQEIVQGSTATDVGTGQPPVYVPTTNANMVPMRSGNPAATGTPAVDPIPNLIRRSVRADAIAAPGVPSLASAVNSAADPALNGGAVTPARWNLHYLIPRFDADGTAATPDSATGFTAPDWVLVTRGGAAVQTGIGTGDNAPNNPNPANTNYVVGRYAFAMYDEGGLLDLNVAGYPTPATPAALTGFTPVQVSQKGSLALADLTRLPTVKNPASTGDYLAQASIDNLVGWRNYASAQPVGSFPNYTFDAAASARYYDYVRTNRNGFLGIDPTVQFNGQTDQRFASRQQLISLSDSLGISRNALQYLTTFSRALEQPSAVPAHIQYPTTAPSINAVAASAPPSASAVDSYLGNNDAAGSSGSISGQDIINPAFLTVRVKAPFTRQDGSTALVGEPLVKRRFALSRLAEITFSTADTTPSVTDPTAATNHIKDWFGLSRTSASDPWIYNHGAANIMTLSQVAAANREPDFAELLKAAINVGSLAKGGPNLRNDQGNYQYTLDVSVDYQVLQIMANLIDQADADSYPTVIQLAAGGGMRTIRGEEDLPYFYRYHPMSVVTRLPVPLLSANDTVQWSNTGSSTPFLTSRHAKPMPASGLTDPGQAVLLYIPEVWNPSDANTPGAAVNGARPTRYRLTVETIDPVGQTPRWSAGMIAQADGTWYNSIPPTAAVPAATAPLLEGTTSFTFSDDGGKLFREPTLLWRADAPTNIGLTPDTGSLAGPYTDANTGASYYGVQVGKSVVSYVGSVSRNTYVGNPQAPDDNYLFQAAAALPNYSLPPGANVQYTFRLQYQDPNGRGWVTYDEKHPDVHGLYRPTLVVNKADPQFANGAWKNPLPNRTGQMSDSATGYDPRTARFGIGVASTLDADGRPAVLEQSAASNYNTNSDAGNTAILNSRFTVLGSQRPSVTKGNRVNYVLPGMTSDPGKNPQMRWFSGVGYSASNGQNASPLFYDGVLFGLNNPAVTLPSRDNSSTARLYYEDADGVARRAMGAYADTTLTAADSPVGQPLATANAYTDNGPASGKFGVGTPTTQSQSRPLVLNRPFRSVAEMSYAFRGTPWKQIDFFTPESGDAFLLDTFCLNEPPPGALVAGKVNLNTRQAPVLAAILAGAYRDEAASYATPPSYALSALSATEAKNVAAKLLAITTADVTAAPWRGPLTNVGHLAGRFVPSPGSVSTATDQYTFSETVTGKSYTYAGLSAALDNTVYDPANATNHKVQRMREAAIRPLADTGQTRVWNILIDLVTQTGNFPAEATSLGQFAVAEENHYWLHVAIDRFTGQVLDQSLEQVFEGVTGLALNATAVPENQPAGTVVGTILPTDANPSDTLTYSLVSGAGDNDNAFFTVSGNTLQTAGAFQYLSRPSYNVRLRAANALGQGFERAFTITVLPGAYTRWKIANFGDDAAHDPLVAGDTADPDHDGLANLLEYALGTSPTGVNPSGITSQVRDGTLTMNYTRASTATDITVQTFWSPNLADPAAWTRTGITETMLSDDGSSQRWQATVPVQNNRTGFMQLRVTRP